MPKVLLESFPLTLKKGTGIYTYSLNLLRSLNHLSIDQIGLLLLFETRFKKLAVRRHKRTLVVLRNYADLMNDLARGEGISVNGWRRFTWLAKSLIKEPGLIDVPSYMKPSLREILTENTPTPYDFLAQNHPYIVDMSRPQLLVKSRIDSIGKIRVKRLAEAYDVFHCTHLSPLKVDGLPRVTTIHDIIPLLRPELTKDNRRVFAELLAVNLQQSDRIIAVSETTKKDLIEFGNVDPEKIAVIYEAAAEGLVPSSFEESIPYLRSLRLINSSNDLQPYFLFIGNIEPKKNVRRLLEAFQQFSLRDELGYKLVIVGSKAWGFDAVKDLLDSLIKRDRVILTGYLSVDYLPALLSWARAFLFPSLIEGFGLPVLEAMACGCPVITSTASAIREVCGDAAIQVDPQSIADLSKAISRIAVDDDLCFKLRQAGFEQNARFSWERCAKETLVVYEQAKQIYADRHKSTQSS